MLIKNISLKFGTNRPGEHLLIDSANMVLFVGPNNSGKSLLLREMEDYLSTGGQIGRKIIDSIEYDLPEDDDGLTRLLLIKGSAEPAYEGHIMAEGTLRFGKLNPGVGYKELSTMTIKQMVGVVKERNDFKSKFVELFSVRLDGLTRLKLIDQQPSHSILKDASNHLMALMKDDELRKTIRKQIYNAFGVYFALNVTNPSQVSISISDIEPADIVEKSFNSEAAIYHANAVPINHYGDGIKAFLGLSIAAMSSDFRVLLIDEPEAFLHPPLAYQLGRNLSALANSREGNLFVSTHSSNFMMGCIQSGVPVNIVRLTYKLGVPTARILQHADLKNFMRNPIMKSAGVLSALFHEGAIVTEDDSDRVFYQEINERNLVYGKNGASGILFLNSNGKAALYKIIKPLRSTGVPAAAIADFDILFGAEFGTLLDAAFIPEGAKNGIKSHRDIIISSIDQSMAKTSGVRNLLGQQKNDVHSLINTLNEYGIFVVPNGELESWLPDLNIQGKKINWLINAVEILGTEPNESDFVKPSDGDVWLFMESISNWINNPLRLGMP